MNGVENVDNPVIFGNSLKASLRHESGVVRDDPREPVHSNSLSIVSQ